MDKIVGIDLGTSTSVLAAVVDGEPVVVPDSRGNRVTPSYIHIMEGGRILVGPQAKAEVISDPFSTIWATKRLIGRRYNDPRVQDAKKHLGYKIQRDEDGNILVTGRDRHLTPVEVGAIILKYLTRIGKKGLGQDIKKAIITVPAYFTDPQRKASRECGSMIGLDVVRLINEPTAAALAYGYENDAEQTVAIYDLGGGTFDLSILSIGQGVYEVVATAGDSYLGGEDFDNRLVDYLVQDFKKKYKIDIYNDKMAHQRVKDAAERAKISLSKKSEVEINLPAICPDLNRWAGVEAVITADQYESMVEDLVDRPIEIFRKLLQDVSMDIKDIDNVIMVGGMTRMPLVRKKTAEFIGKEPDTSMNPDEAVAVGAAIHAASLAGEKLIKTKKPARAAVAPAAERARAGADLGRDSISDQEKTMPGVPGLGTMDEVTEKTADMDMTSPGRPEQETVKETPPTEEQADEAHLLPMDPHQEVAAETETEAEETVQEQAPPAQEAEEWMDAVAEEEMETEDQKNLGDYNPSRESLDDFFAGDAGMPSEDSAPVALDDAGEEHEKAVEMAPAEFQEKSFEERAQSAPLGADKWEDIVDVAPPRDQPDISDDRPMSAGPIERDYEEGQDLPMDREAKSLSFEAPPPGEEAAEEARPEEDQLPVDPQAKRQEEEQAQVSAEEPAEAGPVPMEEAAPEEAAEAAPIPMEEAEEEEAPAEEEQLPVDPQAQRQEEGAEVSAEGPAEAGPVPMEEATPEEAAEAAPIPMGEAEEEEAPAEEDQLPVDPQAQRQEEGAEVSAEGPAEAAPMPMEEAEEEEAPAEEEQLPMDPQATWSTAEEQAPEEIEAAEAAAVEAPPEEPAPPEEVEAPAEEKAEEDTYQAPVLLDVLSQSVGLAHFGGHYVPLIKRFAKLPARASQIFTTCKDSQKRIRITVMQGDGKYVRENTPLGEFVLDGIEEARRGVPEIEVTFDIDQSGLFIISARDKKTGAEQEIRLESWGGLSESGQA